MCVGEAALNQQSSRLEGIALLPLSLYQLYKACLEKVKDALAKKKHTQFEATTVSDGLTISQRHSGFQIPSFSENLIAQF
jgi:hypothetical protein